MDFMLHIRVCIKASFQVVLGALAMPRYAKVKPSKQCKRGLRQKTKICQTNGRCDFVCIDASCKRHCVHYPTKGCMNVPCANLKVDHWQLKNLLQLRKVNVAELIFENANCSCLKPPITDSLLRSGSKEENMLTAPFKSRSQLRGGQGLIRAPFFLFHMCGRAIHITH